MPQSTTMPIPFRWIAAAFHRAGAAFHCWRGDRQNKKGNYERASQYYQQSIEHKPTLKALHHLGRVCMHKRHYETAREYLEEALNATQKPSWQASIYSDAAAIYQVLGSPEQELECYNQAIQLDKRNAKRYGERGNFYYRHHTYPEAIADYTRAIELQPRKHKHARYYYQRGLCHEHKLSPDYPAALADYRHPAALGWQFWPQAIEAAQRVEQRLNEPQGRYWRGRVGHVAGNSLPVMVRTRHVP